MSAWSPSSWRSRPAAQLPAYADPAALAEIESCLQSASPLVSRAECAQLQSALAGVARGGGFLLQGGDCAETFAEFGADRVRLTFNLLLEMSAAIRASGCGEVVTVGRIAGQFAKPRSADMETLGDITLPTYRGDIVNGPDFDPVSRAPDPMRMLEAHRQSRVTVELLKAFSLAAYAHGSDLHRRARARLGLRFDHGAPARGGGEPRIYTSHEALLLPYEQALTHWDPESERWWSASAHMLWLGDRTRQLDGAHVEFASGIANTIGLKCGPSLSPDALLALIERLDPDNRPGRLVLIGRFGAKRIGDCLPALMRATRTAGRHAIWSIDPMHGNTLSAGGRKTRLVRDIAEEIALFFDIASAEGVHAGGVHLELTGTAVTECLGGKVALVEGDLSRNYLTHCDPRLNRAQATEIAEVVARRIAAGPNAESDAA